MEGVVERRGVNHSSPMIGYYAFLAKPDKGIRVTETGPR